MRYLLLIVLLPAICFARSAEEIVAELIAAEWQPLNVRVEWTFTGETPDLDNESAYELERVRTSRPGGRLTLKLVPVSGESAPTMISGFAKVFGRSWAVKEYLPIGAKILRHKLELVELDWTNLNRDPVTEFDDSEDLIAARGLVPGRPICESDLDIAPVITRQQPVILEYVDGNVMIALSGVAMADGAVGDVIPVRVELEHNKRYRGEVLDENRVRFTAR